MSPGDKANTWGIITNTNLGSLLEQAICGYIDINLTSNATKTLTPSNYALDEARSAVLNVTGAITATVSIIAPTAPKIYIIRNNTTGAQSIIIKTLSGAGVTIANGKMAIVFCNGSGFEQVIPQLANNATTAVSATNSTNATNVTGVAGILGYSTPTSTISYVGPGGPQVMGSTTNAAMITFHRAGAYAVNFGLDTDNVLKVGGYSIGAAAYPIYHAGNPQVNISGNAVTATTAAACSGNSTTATTAAACSGNSTTATTSAACSGNAATATTATNLSGGSVYATSGFFTSTVESLDEVKTDSYFRSQQLVGTGVRSVTCTALGAIQAESDERLKTRVFEEPLPGLVEVLQLQPRAYKWNDDIENRGDDAAIEIGFFANETATIIPSSAPMGADSYYGFYDRPIIAALVKAVQELSAKVTALEAK
jgi:hypothetical protein